MKESCLRRGLASLLWLTLFAPSLLAQSRLVEEIEIRGYRSVSIEEIRKHIKTTVGDEFDPEQLRRDLESIMSIEKFDKLKSSVVTDRGPRGQVKVIFKLVEHQ